MLPDTEPVCILLGIAALPALSEAAPAPIVVVAPFWPPVAEPVPLDCAKAGPATKRAAAAVKANVLILIVFPFLLR
jgi:hypothetical protein